MDNLNFSDYNDHVLISTDKYSFFVKRDNLPSLKQGLSMHYEHNEKLTNASDEDLAQMHKKRPRRTAIDEINYQIERKGYNGQIIVPNDLLSRLPLQSQSRNRNGKQHIANKRWRHALKDRQEKVLALNEYYKKESEFMKTFLTPEELYSLPKGAWSISPCHIVPALTNRDEEAWSSDKICRDLSIMNKGYQYVKTPLQGRHAINKAEAFTVLKYLMKEDVASASPTKKAMFFILWCRMRNNFYDKFDITDLGLELF